MENNSMNSINNSIGKVNSPDHEESGWTMYFDDFFNQQNQNENSCFSSGLECSLISDTAFSAAKNNKAVADNEQVMGFSQEKRLGNRPSFKKRKNKAVVVDDDLEDTASSPAHSPKVCNLTSSEYLDKRSDQNNIMDISQENKGSSSAQIEERSGVDSINGRDNNETELKKRGLCLVPLSMIVDYLG